MSAQPANPNLPPDHVTVIIDGVELAAPKGSMIIHVADKAGISIPRFCYHEKLPIAANCRMCLVDTEVGGRSAPKPSPACATPVMDGMKVFTRNDKALKAQRNVMEFLLINHPLDCPICDQGGECELQDLSLGYGRSVSRFAERKRVVPDEDLGPLVATEMTRCIQCTRCIRFTAEVAGTYELGGMQRGENLQIGTFDGKPLTTELSGNVIDVCPVGALTNKIFRFRARPWELMARESLGYHDALGSNLFLHLRRGEVLRSVPRENDAVNECWLSDRDRYSHQGLYAQDRARTPLIRVAHNGDDEDWYEVSWDEALDRAVDILRAHRGDDLGVLVHPATSNEEGALLAHLAVGLECGNLDHRITQRDLSDGAHASVFAASVAEIEQADSIVIIGSNLRHEVPLLHQRVRKAWKNGAKIHVINPVDFEFAFDAASKAIVAPSQLAEALNNDLLNAALKESKHLVVLVGAIAENAVCATQIRASVNAFAARHIARVCRIPQGANAIGLTQTGVLPSARDAQAMLADARNAYVLYGIEPGLDFADQALALKALSGAKVIAFSQYACTSIKAVADVIFPIGALPEIEASLTNLDGRVQTTVAGGKLPGDARPGWRVLRALGEDLNIAGFDFAEISDVRALPLSASAPKTLVTSRTPSIETNTGFELVLSQAIYRSDAVTRRAAALQVHPLTTGPRITLHPEDAAKLSIEKGAMVKVNNGNGAATLPAVLSDRVARGAVWVESGYPATAALTAARVEVKPA